MLFLCFIRISCRSTLVLCPPPESLQESTKEKQPNENCELCKQYNKQKKKSKANSPQSPTTRPIFTPAHLLSDTMYTNVANLQQTMLLQQQLFRQALGQHGSDFTARPSTSFTTPSLSQYQFVSGHKVSTVLMFDYCKYTRCFFTYSGLLASGRCNVGSKDGMEGEEKN